MRSRNNGKNGFHFFRKKGCHYMLLIPLLMAFQGTQAQNTVPTSPSPSPTITHTVTFNQASLTVSDIIGADDHPYMRVSYQGLQNVPDNPTNAGSPSLPVQYVHLVVPRDKNYSSITVEANEVHSIQIPERVFPAQYPIPTAEPSDPVPFAAPNPEIYNVESPYPSVLVKYVGEGYYDGNKHVITVAVYPVQYVPSASRLDLYGSITFHVNENPDVPVTLHSLTREPVHRQDLYNGPLQQMIDNPGDLTLFTDIGNAQVEPGPWTNGTAGKFKFYEYIIITSRDLIPSFEELLGWKRRKGLNAGIIDIQDILSDPAYSGGDMISGINDDAGKLRAYLEEAWKNGTVYAVLGGDSTIIPLRYAAGDNNTFSNGDSRIPSDLYYTDFNGDWDVDGDIYYGESYGDDAVDYGPEIFVGRMLVNTPAQAVNHIHNVIRYERNPGRDDNAYVTRAFMTQADQIVDNDEAGLVSAELTFYSPGSISVWDELPSGSATNFSGPNASAVVSEITKHYGLVSLMGHGSPNNIAVGTSDYNGCGPYLKQKVTFLDAVNGWCAPTQAGNGLDNIDDFDHVTYPYHNFPHIFYTNACETVPYDNWLKTPGDADMGMVYSNYYKGGTAAYFGNTRYGWVWTSSVMYAEFAKKIAQGNYHIGVAEGLSKQSFFSGWGWCEKTHVLVGCPETEMWTKYPARFRDATVTGSNGTITVNTGGVTGATICIMSALDNGWSFNQVVVGATSYTFYGVPADYAVCINKHDYIPYLWSRDVLVQSHDFYGAAYVASPNDITCGEAVDKNNPTGPVTVKSGGNVYFHADSKGTILLDRGFEVEPDAAFEAK